MADDPMRQLRAVVQHAVTHAERVGAEARERARRQQEEARGLGKALRGPLTTAAGQLAVAESQASARAFRISNGLSLPESVRIYARERSEEPRVGDGDEDFSRSRIMRRVDGTPG